MYVGCPSIFVRVLCGKLASMVSVDGSGMVGTKESMTDTVTFVCVVVGFVLSWPVAAAWLLLVFRSVIFAVVR